MIKKQHTGKKPDDDAININKFEISEDNTVKKCPAGNEPQSTSYDVENHTIIAKFSKETCQSCEFKNRCCVKTQVKSNKFSTTVESIEIQNKRDEIKNDIKENNSMQH